ncbi:MAG: c-type cytochrome [Rhodospirillaceae bacterium]|nr:c-type cytochrome [Rhodospirillaceae bacterium]
MNGFKTIMLMAAACMLNACGDSNAKLMERLAAVDIDSIKPSSDLHGKAMLAGQKLFAQHCAQCHGGGEVPRAVNVPDLSDDYWLIGGENLDDFNIRASDIEKRIRFGIRADHDATWKETMMPPRGGASDLTPLEIYQVAEYVLERAGATDIDLEIAMHGEAVYTGKGGCYDCHGQKGEGASAFGATDLTRPQYWLYGKTRAAVTDVITAGAAGVSPAFEGKLTPGEMKATAIYVHGSAKSLGF